MNTAAVIPFDWPETSRQDAVTSDQAADGPVNLIMILECIVSWTPFGIYGNSICRQMDLVHVPGVHIVPV